METVRVVLGKDLLRGADRVARLHRTSRSALIREALREHLKRLAVGQREGHDREGYAARPTGRDDLGVWDKFAEWPDA
jgi:metal-responsive CopG/Arc/MetJ family transcriptional regulator